MPENTLHDFHAFTSQEARDRFLAHLDVQEQDWPINYERQIVRSDYGETFVRISGPIDGSPIVLLPGGQSGSLVWRRLIEPLATRCSTFALDTI